MAVEVVAIGASWGGLQAVGAVLADLPGEFGAAVVLAQHRPADTPTSHLETLLDARCALTVCEAEDKQALAAATVLVAPAGYHMLVEQGSVALSVDEPRHHSRPSIDVLLGSAADAYGERACGVVLTGANADGAEGLAAIARRGGATIVQDPGGAERREMPDAALAMTPDARVVGLADIGALLCELASTAPEPPS